MNQTAAVFGRGHVVVQVVGNGNNTVLAPNEPHLELTRHFQRRRIREQNGEALATDLISAYSRSVPLRGREADSADFMRWLENGEPISVRVLIGSAGRGKTRLALELCDAATEKGWGAGFLTSGELQRFRGQQNLAAWGWKEPVLAVIDYVASQADLVHQWLVELADNEAGSDKDAGRKRPLRLLLLERQADVRGGWWQTAFGRGGGDARAVHGLLASAGPMILRPIEDVEIRRQIIADMLERAGVAERPPARGQDPYFDRKLAELSWGGEPLFLTMAGLTAARVGVPNALALSRDDLAFEIGDHELARVARIARSNGVSEEFACHMAGVTTLCLGLDQTTAYETIEREKAALGYEQAGDRATVYRALQEALSHEEAELEPILPDMIGEAVMLRLWGSEADAQGTETVLRAAAGSRTRVAETVIRSCQDFAINGHAAPLAWLDALGEEAVRDVPALLELLNALPEETLELRERAASLTETAVAAFRERLLRDENERDHASLANLLNNLSVRLSDLGRREDALAAIEEALAIQRDLAAARPDVFRPDLATSLNSLSNRLSALGRREDALAAIEEAVAIRRDFAAARPDAFRSDLATSLNNLSNHLSDLGRHEDALAAIEEALAIQRDLAPARPDAFRPDVARSLTNLSGRLSDIGRHDDALVAIEEALPVYRDLAATRPDAIRPVLAFSLNNLSNRLSDLGRSEEALAAIEEAVAIQRDLAANRPDAFSPGVVRSLNNLSNRLSALGRREDALAAIEEAVAVYRNLAADRPDAFRPDLAASLNNMSGCLSALGRREDALAAIEEAVTIRRDLATARPDAFRPDLANSCGARGTILRAMERHSDAAASIAEGLVAITPQLLRLPAAFAQLAQSLLHDYRDSAQSAGIDPDVQMLAPIFEKLVEVGTIVPNTEKD